MRSSKDCIEVPATESDVKDLASEIEKKAVDTTIHSGLFRATILLENAESAVADDARLQALPGDRLVYTDDENTGAEPVTVFAKAKTVEGNLGGVRVTRTETTPRAA